MPCDLSVLNSDVTLDCADVPVGGLVSVYVARYADVTATTEVDGELTAITVASGKVVNLEFNPKDGFSSFTDTKTVDENGSVIATPEIVLEFPKTTLEKRNALEKLSMPNSEYIVFVETSAGEKHAAGIDFGLTAAEVNGGSGAQRSDKNAYNIKFSGEETHLARFVTDSAWASVVAAKKA